MTPDPEAPWQYPVPPGTEEINKEKQSLLVWNQEYGVHNPPSDKDHRTAKEFMAAALDKTGEVAALQKKVQQTRAADAARYQVLREQIEATDYFQERRHAQQMARTITIPGSRPMTLAILEHPEGGYALKISEHRHGKDIQYRWAADEAGIERAVEYLKAIVQPEGDGISLTPDGDELTTQFRRFGGIMKAAGCQGTDFAACTLKAYESLGILNGAKITLTERDRSRVTRLFRALADLPVHRRPTTLHQLQQEITFQAARIK